MPVAALTSSQDRQCPRAAADLTDANTARWAVRGLDAHAWLLSESTMTRYSQGERVRRAQRVDHDARSQYTIVRGRAGVSCRLVRCVQSVGARVQMCHDSCETLIQIASCHGACCVRSRLVTGRQCESACKEAYNAVHLPNRFSILVTPAGHSSHNSWDTHSHMTHDRAHDNRRRSYMDH